MRYNRIKKFAVASVFAAMTCIFTGFTSVEGYDGNPDEWDIDNSQFVYDYADLMSDSQELKLQELCEDVGEKTELDLVVVTTSDLGRHSVSEYADLFFEEGGYGYECEIGSGVLYLIDMDSRNIYISTSDLAMMYIEDGTDVELLLDIAYEKVSNEDYYDSAVEVIEKIEDIVLDKKSDKQFKELENLWSDGDYKEYDRFEAVYSDQIRDANKETFFSVFKSPLVCLGVALVIAIIAIICICISASPRMTAGSRTYMRDGSFDMHRKFDRFSHRTTKKRKVESSSGGGGGSGHRSSGGHSHGGGGRSF